MAKFEVHVSVGLVGCDKTEIIEIPDEELAEMQEAEIEAYMLDEMFQLIEWNYRRIED